MMRGIVNLAPHKFQFIRAHDNLLEDLCNNIPIDSCQINTFFSEDNWMLSRSKTFASSIKTGLYTYTLTTVS